MKKKHLLLVFALAAAPLSHAQTTESAGVDSLSTMEDELQTDDSNFTFTESQLGENDDITSDVIRINSATNVYASQISWTWSGIWFKYRALDNAYNDIYMNGVQVNNPENGRFSYSTIGGMNDAVRNKEDVSPFEGNNFSFSGMGGSSNYNLRASQMPAGHKVTLSGANRNYTLRAMYSYGTGLSKDGWAFFGTVGYRWSNMQTAAIKGTFYNSLAYFLSAQKIINDKHSISLATWGSPTERATAGASTDEAYWLANDYQYNPYWGYQGGKKRASRIVNNFEPSVLATWDFNIKENMKLTTSFFFKLAKYKSTKLNYSGTNPHPDYWKRFPSYNYDVWGRDGDYSYDNAAFWTAYENWQDEPYRQINFDELYFANTQLNKIGADAIYWIEARHNNHLMTNLSSTYDWNIKPGAKFSAGVQLLSNRGSHYRTIEDLLGGEYFHNTNTYLVGDYQETSTEAMYDVNHGYQKLIEGDRYGYDYNLWNQDVKLWAGFSMDRDIVHSFITGKIGGRRMWREGFMRNGLFQDNSYGKSGIAHFLDGGMKMGSTINLGKGHAITAGLGYELRAPGAAVAFMCPEMNNDYVQDLRNEKVLSAELGYAISNKWFRLNVNGYYYYLHDGNEWQQFYNDDSNSFSYNSLTGVKKEYAGVEVGLKVKLTSNLDLLALGTYSEAKYIDDTEVSWMNSTSGEMHQELCHNDGMRVSGTPLAAASLGLNYRIKRWYLNLTGNYYDRIYLSYSTNMRYEQNLKNAGRYHAGEYDVPEQAKGHGGFMLDASIGRQFYVFHHPLSVNLQLCNLTNRRNITTGGYEQSRSNYSVTETESTGTEVTTKPRTYNFEKNAKKFYAQGFNFLLNLNYRF
ncbi:MAG: TonB-dependent receptor [Bacteroidaceae bacterium]|nr:TonB-dependent receptor [Bacteroidaceae bacterium]